MNISAPFIKRPVMTTLVMIAIFICGIRSYYKLPVSDLPNVEHPSITVHANYNGAEPQTMVNLVTIPLEKELISVKGVKEISSKSNRGFTSIDLEFDFEQDMDEALRQVQTALNRAQGGLPSDLEHTPTYEKNVKAQMPIMFLVLTSPTASVTELREYSDLYLKPKLSRVEGVAAIETFGEEYSIKIKLDPAKMAAHKIGLNEVIDAIKSQNAEIPLGSIKTTSRVLSIEMQSGLKTPKDFENILIAEGPVRLKDIGSVTDETEDGVEFHYVEKTQTRLAVILGIKKQNGSNAVTISRDLNQVFTKLQKDLPANYNLKIIFDQAVWINESIQDVKWSMIFAFILVVVVIFFSLGRFTEALIPSIALPMSLVGTFIPMYLLDYNLDLLSLLALTLAVGFVVDDAIVVLENIVRHTELGKSRLEASLIGSKEIGFTILSMTLSLVAVFIPLLFMGGINGRLFGEFSVTLAVAILVSGFISLTLTPMLCSLILGKHTKATNLQRIITSLNAKWVGWYEGTLRWVVHHPKTILTVSLLCFAMIYPLFLKLPIALTPEEDRGFIFTHVMLSSGISDEKSSEYQHKIESILSGKSYVDYFIDIKGGDFQGYYMRLVDKKDRPSQRTIISELQTQIDSIPGTQSFLNGYQLFNLNDEIEHGGNYQYLIRGSDFSEVMQAGEALKKSMQGMTEFTFVSLNVTNDEPKLNVQVHVEQVEKLGFTKKDIQVLLQQFFSGGNVSHVQKNGNQNSVYVSLEKEFKKTPSSLSKLYLKSSEGEMIPLKSFVNWVEILGTPTLNRYDQLPSVTVNFAVNDNMPLNDILGKLEEMGKQLPYEVQGKLHGAAEIVKSTVSETVWLILASVIVMYIVLGILYENLVHPLTILSSLPFAGLGGIITLMLFNESLTIFSLVGFLLLIGIVKKNGIMIVDFALEALKKPGVTPEQAVIQGCLVRFRPIMMTTIAAIMGALPIAIGFGEGSETRRGLGLVIVGGLVFSQMLTLYVTPVLYILFEKGLGRFSKIKSHEQEAISELGQ